MREYEAREQYLTRVRRQVGLVVDHIDGDPGNNAVENLRVVKATQR